MSNNIFIEPETMRKAEENTREAFQAAHDAIKNGTPDGIRAADGSNDGATPPAGIYYNKQSKQEKENRKQ